jgi:flagellar L-ring protein precursor FlgH
MAETQTVKESKVAKSVGALFGLKQDIVTANPNLGGNIEMDTSGSSSYNGDGNTSRQGVVRGQITCRVVEVREDTGNLVVFGWKEVRANRETQYLSLSGVVRPQDIRNDNTISSQVIAEAKIEFTGSGVVSDKQGPGFGTRLLDHVWPF